MVVYKGLIKTLAISSALSVVLIGCSESSDYVAKIEGEKILQTELDEALRSQYGAEMLDTLINNKIVELEAKKVGITVSEEAIQAEYDELVESYGGADALQAILDGYGLTEKSVKDDIRMYQLTKEVIVASIQLSDEEVEQYFEDNKDSYGQAEQVVASHILLEDEAAAKEVLVKIQAGEDFEELAKAFSKDEETSADGGDLGYISRGQMDESFEEVVFSLEKGAVSEVVQTPEGYHIIKVTDKVPAQEAVFEDVKDDVYAALLEERVNEEYMSWLTEKKEQYEIETK